MKKPLQRPPPRWKAFAGDDKGIIIVMFALMLPLLVGFIGLGVEVAFWFTLKRDIQAAADAAAVAGSYELAEGRSSNITTVATREATSNGWESCGGDCITVKNPPTNTSFPTYLANTSAVEVELTRSENRLFSGWFMSDTVTINARAVGLAVAGSSTACILALGSGNPSNAVKVGGNATVTMSGCTVATNSTDDGAIDVDGGLTVDCIYSAGGIDVSGNTNPDTTECASPGRTNQPTIANPYDTAPPTKPVAEDFDDCDSNGDTSNADGADYNSPSPPADAAISEGVYCDIRWNSNTKLLTMSAGTYYIDRGDFEVGSGAIVDGLAGVTIVFGDSTWDGTAGTANCGGFKVSGASYVDLTAPVTADGEPFTGMAIYRSSICDDGGGDDIEFTGSTTSTIIGAIYNPSGDIKITGSGSLSGDCLQLIGNTVTFTGNSSIGSSCDGVDIQTVTAGGKGSLVE